MEHIGEEVGRRLLHLLRDTKCPREELRQFLHGGHAREEDHFCHISEGKDGVKVEDSEGKDGGEGGGQ